MPPARIGESGARTSGVPVYEYTWTSAIFMDDVGVLEFATVCQLEVGDPATCNSIISWYGSEAMVTPLDASTCHTCFRRSSRDGLARDELNAVDV